MSMPDNHDRSNSPEPIDTSLPEVSAAENDVSENISEVAMRLSLLGKLIIPPSSPDNRRFE